MGQWCGIYDDLSKDFGVSWPIAHKQYYITTADGTIIVFGAGDTTTNYYYGGGDSTHQSYTSAWDLTQMISADHKDTIQLNYSSYSWQQAGVSYQTSYIKSTTAEGVPISEPLGLLPVRPIDIDRYLAINPDAEITG